MFQVHEVAVSTPAALSINELPATSLPEISDLSELRLNWFACIETTLEHLHRFQRRLLVNEFDISISNDVIANIVANNQIFNFSVVGQLLEDFRVKSLKMVRGLIKQFIVNIEASSHRHLNKTHQMALLGSDNETMKEFASSAAFIPLKAMKWVLGQQSISKAAWLSKEHKKLVDAPAPMVAAIYFPRCHLAFCDGDGNRWILIHVAQNEGLR